MTDEPPDLGFAEPAALFESPSQNARQWTEQWAGAHLFCPNCAATHVEAFARNRKVADFFCPICAEEYELKAQKGRFGRTVVDGALAAMRERLIASNNPSLVLMNYDLTLLRVTDLFFVPRHFFVPEIIQARPPLASTARRAGWIGCNIRLDQVPASGKIFYVRSGEIAPRDLVVEQWRRTLFLRGRPSEARGWLIEVMKCVDELGPLVFDLADVYAFEGRLHALYPANRNVRPKIRQQLQVLRDSGYLEFVGRGRYRVRSPA
ncbi:MAG: DpnI domain-containing protein [Caulobacteraceae bacterium]